jgi:hypothetical protein
MLRYMYWSNRSPYRLDPLNRGGIWSAHTPIPVTVLDAGRAWRPFNVDRVDFDRSVNRKPDASYTIDTYAMSQKFGGLLDKTRNALQRIADVKARLSVEEFEALYKLLSGQQIDPKGQLVRDALDKCAAYFGLTNINLKGKYVPDYITASQIRSNYGKHLTDYWIEDSIRKDLFPHPARRFTDKRKSKRLWERSEVEKVLGLR